MKRLIALMALALILGAGAAQAQEKKFSLYGVGFYNLENLFDTCHDVGHNDYQYLPDGQLKWNGLKYAHKLRNMARTSAPQIFTESIFPKAFGIAAQDSYMESQDTYTSLFADQAKYNAMMHALASIVYRDMRVWS